MDDAEQAQFAQIEEKWRRGFEALVGRVNEQGAQIETLARELHYAMVELAEMHANQDHDRALYLRNLAHEAAAAGVTVAELAKARRDVEAE